MIIFVEDRQLVVDGYKERFEKAGETLIRIASQDIVEWLETSSVQELASVEAILVGETEDSAIVMEAVRRKMDVPVVALLDNRSLEQTIRFYRLGVDDVVSKPVHYEELLIRIATIKKRFFKPAAKTEVQPIVVFFDGRDPEIAGEQILLPRRERRILEYLVANRGRRVTKQQIFNAIYGIFDEDVEENVVESHISKLRKKLGMDEDDRWIHALDQ